MTSSAMSASDGADVLTRTANSASAAPGNEATSSLPGSLSPATSLISRSAARVSRSGLLGSASRDTSGPRRARLADAGGVETRSILSTAAPGLSAHQ